jgi:hypothetical protein
MKLRNKPAAKMTDVTALDSKVLVFNGILKKYNIIKNLLISLLLLIILIGFLIYEFNYFSTNSELNAEWLVEMAMSCFLISTLVVGIHRMNQKRPIYKLEIHKEEKFFEICFTKYYLFIKKKKKKKMIFTDCFFLLDENKITFNSKEGEICYSDLNEGIFTEEDFKKMYDTLDGLTKSIYSA